MDLLSQLEQLESLYRPTPVIRLAHPRFDLFAKLEYYNPTHSVKDRSAFYVLRKNVERGLIGPRTTIIESSSGNFAIALANLCKGLGLHFIPVVDPNISPLNLRMLEVLCTDIIKVTETDEHGGYQKRRIAVVQQYIQDNPGAFWPNQYANPDCMNAHYHLTAREITEQVEHLDYALLPVSSGGIISGCSRRLKEHFPHIQIVAVDAEGSMIFGGHARKRYIPGIGSTSRPELLQYAAIDEVIKVPEADTVQGCWDLLHTHGIFAGGSSGSCFAALNLLQAADQRKKPQVIFLCPDRGTSYIETVYNDSWCSEKIKPFQPEIEYRELELAIQ